MLRWTKSSSSSESSYAPTKVPHRPTDPSRSRIPRARDHPRDHPVHRTARGRRALRVHRVGRDVRRPRLVVRSGHEMRVHFSLARRLGSMQRAQRDGRTEVPVVHGAVLGERADAEIVRGGDDIGVRGGIRRTLEGSLEGFSRQSRNRRRVSAVRSRRVAVVRAVAVHRDAMLHPGFEAGDEPREVRHHEGEGGGRGRERKERDVGARGRGRYFICVGAAPTDRRRVYRVVLRRDVLAGVLLAHAGHQTGPDVPVLCFLLGLAKSARE